MLVFFYFFSKHLTITKMHSIFAALNTKILQFFCFYITPFQFELCSLKIFMEKGGEYRLYETLATYF